MDKRLWVLALGMFALGTDTFVVAGVLPQIARTFDVDIALAPTSTIALVSRVFAGLGAAMYAPTATGTGATIVAPESRGQAIAIIVAGLTAATALGSPIGTVLGGLSNWRWTMYFVSAVGLAAGLGIMALLHNVPLPPKIGLNARLAPLQDSRIGWTLITTYLGMAGNFLVYVYFSVVFDRVLVNAVVFGSLLVVWGVSGTATSLNTAATYLGVTTAGILGAVGIHLLGAHYLSFLSVGVFLLAIFTSHMAGRRIESHRTADSPAAMQALRP